MAHPRRRKKPYEVISLNTGIHEWYVPIKIQVRTIDRKKENYSFDRHLADRELTENEWKNLKNKPKENKRVRTELSTLKAS